MLNNVVLIGRLTKKPELKMSKSGVSVCAFTLAVDKWSKDDKNKADFISCVAWKQSAEFLTQYGKKGSMVALQGRISTRNYEGQNGKVYVTEVICDSVHLVGKSEEKKEGSYEPPFPDEAPKKEEIIIDSEELPFY